MNFISFFRVVLVLAVSASLSGCLVAMGPSAKNPNSYAVFQYNQPAPQSVIVTEKEPDGKDYQFRYACRPGHQLGYEWRQDDRGQAVRRCLCQTPDGPRAAPRILVVQCGRFGGGSNSPQGLFRQGTRVDCPQVPVGNGLARCQ